MPKLVKELIVPAEYGRGLHVYKGQTLRIIAIEGPQVVDLTFLNAHNYREWYNAGQTYNLNIRRGTGTGRWVKHLYSNLPYSNVMLEVTDDRVAKHWIINGNHCSWVSNMHRGLPRSARSCHGNMADALWYHGIPNNMVPDSFPLWMNVDLTEDGRPLILPSLAEKGERFDLLAHMDVLCAISSCPGNQGGMTELNAGSNKPLKVEVWE